MATPIDESISVGGLTFHYLDWGGAGRPLLLLHGLASNARYWDLAAPFLAGHFRTVALDQRGHGFSGKPDDGYDFPTVAGDVAGFIRALKLERPIIAGHSWGGNVAIQVASGYPGLASALVCIDGGVIEPSAAPGATWEQTELRMAPPDFAALDITWAGLLERSRQWGAGAYRGDKLLDFLRASFDIIEDGRVMPKLTRERHMRIVRALWEQRVSQLYPQVSCPVLLMPVRGAQQESSPGRSFAEQKEAGISRATRLLPRQRLVWMEDSIHDVPVQRPSEVASIIIQASQEGFFDT